VPVWVSPVALDRAVSGQSRVGGVVLSGVPLLGRVPQTEVVCLLLDDPSLRRPGPAATGSCVP